MKLSAGGFFLRQQKKEEMDMPNEMDRLRELHRRRRRKRLVAAALLVPVVALVCGIVLNSLLRVRNIVTENPTEHSGAEILSHLSFDIGDGMFSFDRDKLCRRITAECPYVKSVEITYRLPDTIHLVLTAAVPFLTVEVEGGYLCLDEDFKVLSFTEDLPRTDVILVTGLSVTDYTVGVPLDEDENVEFDSLRELVLLLQDKKLAQNVRTVDLSRKYNITMVYNEVITVSLGNTDDLERKINLLQKILSENDPSTPAEISVRDCTVGRYRRI